MRGKSADKKAACCLSSTATLAGVPSPHSDIRFALAARKGDANKRDHWVVDEQPAQGFIKGSGLAFMYRDPNIAQYIFGD